MPQGLIIRTPISQYTLYSAMFCLLHTTICKEQHKKHPCTLSSHYKKYGEYVGETCAPRVNYWNTHKLVRFVLSYVLSVIQQYKKKQHEKHLCNLSSQHGKYGEYARKTCTLYLNTCQKAITPQCRTHFITY